MNYSIHNIPTLLQSVEVIIRDETGQDKILHEICNLLAGKVSHYDWVGFYLVDSSGKNLVLGPYNGAATDHTKIAFGDGICGQVAVSESSRIIQDVSLESNYLSCSPDVRSEVVFPIKNNGKFVAELDIDSHAAAPFTDMDTELLEAICSKLETIF